ncbi:sigma 54-interacting transcriptional regulator [Myxococcota bacterium]|nr:sigma 54-interacting transcriptional regulator [Myxococcota bacterium]
MTALVPDDLLVLDQVDHARDLEGAGAALLRGVLSHVAAGLALSPGPERGGQLVRAALHVRGRDGYRALVLLDAPGTRASDDPGALHTSGSAWEQVRRRDQAVALDVHLAELRAVGAPGEPPQRLPGRPLGAESVELFLGRGASHVLALPARADGQVQGMVTVELQAMAALGATVEAWRLALPSVQALVDRAFPRVLARSAPVAEAAADAGLPVVGRAMAPVVRLLRGVARFDDTVLLAGPSGVGKTRLARWLHDRSRRARAPFEVAHLQNYPDTLVEGELFGWKRGAHDGARTDKEGHVARAEGGTLFLDEIDKVPVTVQRKLLHLLESRAWRPLGSTGGERTADLRFVVGTNADLDAEVAAGRFLPDLLWRIRTVPVRVPSLDERRDEVRAWAGHFLRRKHERETGRADATLSEAAADLLEGRSWPGNLRQLDQVMVRAWLVAADVEQDGPLHVDSTSMRAALAFDGGQGPAPLDAALRQAAAAFRRELLRRRAEGGRPLTLDDADAFRGYVLAELEAQLGLDAAFEVLGLEARVKARNHHATWKREQERVERLWEPEE